MLWGDDSIFPSAVLPADPIIWNSLQLERFLIVSIRGRSGGSLAFQANVATFYVIPEPSSAALAVLAIAMVARYHLKADRQQSFETTE
jgi:hypothetical protein